MKLSHLIVLSAAVLCSAASVRAQTVAPVPAPTIITTAPYTITTPGYYQLGANLTVTATSGAIITIAASNVTLDFAGHYISGPSTAVATSTLAGVFSGEEGNLIVENGTIAYCGDGIVFYGNNSANSLNVNQTARNMLVTYIGEWGVYLAAAKYCRVTDSVFSNIAGYTGSGNIFSAIAGVVVYEGTGNNISGNSFINITGSTGYGIYGSSTSNLAQNNQFLNCGTGIYNIDKYEGNLTIGCTTPFTGGTSVGTNN